ncbi:MAG: VanW family protein [Armatimonas sp.]
MIPLPHPSPKGEGLSEKASQVPSSPFPSGEGVRGRGKTIASFIALLAIGGFIYLNLRPAPTPSSGALLGTYATSLAERTQGQRHNAIRAAAQLDDVVIPPGGTFSYNRRVRAWATEPGYWKAPVSYAGAMTLAVGGGVCQTSTTLYNAALLAGLEIVERHPHTVLPRYVPPGRDAAVAYPGIDLRLKNPYSFPVRVRARREGESLTVRIIGARATDQEVAIRTQLLSVAMPERRVGSGLTFRRTRPAPGCRVVSWRVVTEGGKEVRREHLADDTYVPLDQHISL